MRETDEAEGAATFDDLQQYATGLVCLTGGDEGPLAASLMRGGEEAGRETVERLVRIFGPKNVYVELQRHYEREEEWRNQAAIRIAHSFQLPVLATNGVRYATAYDSEFWISLLPSAITLNSIRPAVFYLSTASVICEQRMRWRHFFEMFEEPLPTLSISPSRLAFELSDLGYEFPRYPVPDSETMDSFLRKRVAEGVQRRYGSKNDMGPAGTSEEAGGT